MVEDLSVRVLMLNDIIRKKRDYIKIHERKEDMGSALCFRADLLLTAGIFLLTCRGGDVFRYLYDHRHTVTAVYHWP